MAVRTPALQERGRRPRGTGRCLVTVGGRGPRSRGSSSPCPVRELGPARGCRGIVCPGRGLRGLLSPSARVVLVHLPRSRAPCLGSLRGRRWRERAEGRQPTPRFLRGAWPAVGSTAPVGDGRHLSGFMKPHAHCGTFLGTGMKGRQEALAGARLLPSSLSALNRGPQKIWEHDLLWKQGLCRCQGGP